MNATQSTEESQNLMSKFDIESFATCTAEVTNGTPCNWKAVIVKAGVQFYYLEGDSHVDYDNNLNLTCAQSTTFRSNDPDKCVKSALCVLQVKVGNDPNLKTIQTKEGTPEDICALSYDFTLAPKPKVTLAELKSGDIEQLLTIKVS